MKTTITTLAIVAISIIGNINNTFAKEVFYKNNEVNSTGQIIKTTISKGENEKELSLTKLIEYRYDIDGNISERIFSKWDSIASRWIPTEMFEYKKVENGSIEVSAHRYYNADRNKWEG